MDNTSLIEHLIHSRKRFNRYSKLSKTINTDKVVRRRKDWRKQKDLYTHVLRSRGIMKVKKPTAAKPRPAVQAAQPAVQAAPAPLLLLLHQADPASPTLLLPQQPTHASPTLQLPQAPLQLPQAPLQFPQVPLLLLPQAAPASLRLNRAAPASLQLPQAAPASLLNRAAPASSLRLNRAAPASLQLPQAAPASLLNRAAPASSLRLHQAAMLPQGGSTSSSAVSELATSSRRVVVESYVAIGTGIGRTSMFPLSNSAIKRSRIDSVRDMEDNNNRYDDMPMAIASEQTSLAAGGHLYATVTGSTGLYYYNHDHALVAVKAEVVPVAMSMLACGAYASFDGTDLRTMTEVRANLTSSVFSLSSDGPEVPEVRVGAAGVVTKDDQGAWMIKGWNTNEGMAVLLSNRFMLGVVMIDHDFGCITKMTARSMFRRMGWSLV